MLSDLRPPQGTVPLPTQCLNALSSIVCFLTYLRERVAARDVLEGLNALSSIVCFLTQF